MFYLIKTRGEKECLLHSVGSSELSIDFLSWVKHLQLVLFLVPFLLVENVTLGSCGASFFDFRVFQCWDESFSRIDLTLTGTLSFESKNKDYKYIKKKIVYFVAIYSSMYDYAAARKEFRWNTDYFEC